MLRRLRPRDPRAALEPTRSAAALFLLYIGIHNSWDAAIYVSVARRASGKRGTPPE
jgi:hypothetical protein